MPTFVPVDHDPFADDPAPSAPSSAPAISFSSGSGGGGPVFVPVDHDPFAGSGDASSADAGGARPLTIQGAARPTLRTPIAGSIPTVPSGFASPQDAAPAAQKSDAAPGSMSYDEFFPSPTPHAGGALSNSTDDGYWSGAAKGTATALVKAASDVPGMFGSAMDMGDYLVARAQAKITGQPLDDILAAQAAERKASADNPGWSRYLDPRNFLPSASQIAAPVLAQTGEYVPTSETGKIAQSAVEAAAGSLAFGGGVKALLPNAVAGGTAQGATDLTQDPLYGLGAGLISAPIAEAGLSKTASALGPVVGGSDLLNKAPIVGPMIQNARGNKVAGMILDGADNPAAVRAAASQPAPEPTVPGAPQTFAGQIGNDQGLFEAEKALRNTKAEKPVNPDSGTPQAPTYFNAVDRAQSNAQVAALQGIQPTGDVLRPGQVLSQRMDAIDTAAQNAIDRLTAAHADAVTNQNAAGQAFATDQQSGLAQRTADRVQAGAEFAGQTRSDLTDRTIARGQASGDDKAQADAAQQAAHNALVQSFSDANAKQLGTATDAAAPLAGGPVNAADLGVTLRSAVEQVRAGQKDLHSDLYSKVDPTGTLALVATPVGDKASSIMDGLRSNGSELTPAEAPLFRRAASLPDVATYGTLHALDTDLSAAMSTERRASGESPAWARLTQLKGSVKGAMTNAADNQAGWEARQVSAGRMAPQDTISARLGLDANEWDSTAGTQARAATGTGDPAFSGAETSGFSGAPGTQVPGGSRFGNASGDQSLSQARGTGTAPREVGQDRFQAPLYDPDAPTRAPQSPGVPRPQDLHGFVRSAGGIQDTGGDLASMGLGNLIAKPGQGLGPDAMRQAAAQAGYLGADVDHAMANTSVNDLLNAVGSDRPVHSVHDEAAVDAWNRYDQAKADYARAQSESEGRSSGATSLPPRAPLSAYSRDDIEGPSGSSLPSPARSGLTPNFGPEAANRLKAANAAYAEYARTYKNPTVGPGLRTTGYSGQYQKSDAAFIKAAIKPGPEGYENARAFLTAAKNDPDAVAAMHDAALNPLRKATTGNGTLPPTALAKWKSADGYGPALQALDEVTPGFSSRFDEAGKATQALLDLGAQHKAVIDTAQKEAARQAILDNLNRRDGLKQANAADTTATNALLAERKANDTATGQADRTSVMSQIADRAASNKAANAESAANMRAGVNAAKSIVTEAKATPAAQYAKAVGSSIASTEVENAVGSYLQTGTSGATRMRSLVQSTATDPAALDGLRKAGTDWMTRSFTNADGSISGAKLINFVKNNSDTLKELYPHDQVSMFGALARNAEENMRWRTSTAVKGGSDSVKNYLAALDKVEKGNSHVTVGLMATEALGFGLEKMESIGWKAAGLAAIGAGTAYLANTLRQAGIRKTADLYREAMANPEVARSLIVKMPATADSGALHNFARVLKRSLIVGPMSMRAAPPPPGLH